MRKLIVSMNVTLNGFMAGPYGELDWHTPYWDDEMARVISEQLGNADTILLGRNTYQEMAPYWAAQQASLYSPRKDADFADMMNRYEKVVFSKTLTSLNWRNSRLAGRGISQEIKQLKKSAGKDLIVYGSGKLVTTLVRLNVVDEYRIWAYPVAISKGKPLFKNLRERLNMRPGRVKMFDTGVVLMCYETNGD